MLKGDKMTDSKAHFDKMTKAPLARLIISLGIPTTVSMLVTSIYNMADTYFVGTLGESQQAATGILFTLQAIIQAAAFMLGQGSGTMVSKFLADSDEKSASEYVSTAFLTGVGLGLVLMVGGLVCLRPLMLLLGSTKTILPYAMQYGFCVLLSAPAAIGSFILNNNLRYEGKAFYAMIGLVTGGLLNIFGDYMLIRVFHLGVLGAGISTAISQIISFFILIYFFEKMAQSSIRLAYFTKKLSVLFTILRVGFPALIRQGLSSFSNGLLNNLTRPFGDAAIAAMSVVNRFSSFVMCVGLGIGQGFQPVASFNYQAKEYERVKKGLIITIEIGLIFIACLAIPGFIFADKIVYLFQESGEVMRIGTFALRLSCVGVMFLPLSVPVNMLYQSTRKPGLSSVLSLMRSGLMFIPTLLIGTRLWGILGIQIAQPAADILTALFSVPFIIAFLRKKKFTDSTF